MVDNETKQRILSDRLLLFPLPQSRNKDAQFKALIGFLNVIKDYVSVHSFFKLVTLVPSDSEERYLSLLNNSKTTYFTNASSASNVAFVLKENTTFKVSTDKNKPIINTEVNSDSEDREMIIVSNALLHVVILTIASLSIFPEAVLDGEDINRNKLQEYFSKRMTDSIRHERQRLSESS